ncbi:MAG: chemotaxis-specific protein-glutamate methyltransferase CheB [Anaerolineae bacterium]|nr:chemotaxis-specific protein-glutamate methyltransferase CheB [Anaerolineae bacterium]
MSPAPVRVLIAEDSPTVRHHLATIINEAEGMSVVGQARDGEEALRLAQELHPDVISMDIRMPGIDGLETTRRIMSQLPTPVVIVSGMVEREVDLSFQALQVGALAVVAKPPARTDADFASRRRQLVNTLSAMAKVQVVRRWENIPGQNGLRSANWPTVVQTRIKPEIVVIGASAGGPGALAEILGGLDSDFPLPVVIVQHLPNEFMQGLARWLQKSAALPVKIVSHNMVLDPGAVYLAPGDSHLKIERQADRLVAVLIQERGSYRHQPAIDVLFESVAIACGAAAVGVVLTGMGDDGATGMLAMREAGAITLAQDEKTSTVFGMPAAAVARGAVNQVLALSNIATTLCHLI